MGDVEQVMAEPEEVDVIDDVDGIHPPNLDQKAPWLASQIFGSVTTIIASYGWYAVGLVVLLCVAWGKLKPRVAGWKKKKEEQQEAAAYHKDPDKYIVREMAIDRARQRMQEKYNENAVQWAEKQKELEEKKRQQRIEDWERQERGGGSRNRSTAATASPPTVPAATGANAAKNKSGKAKLRPEYNPMTGDVGGGGGDTCRWRPDRRGASGGG